MIGVVANPAEYGVVREFFELFKTPWEFYRSDRRYKVLLCAGDAKVCGTDAELVIIYAASKTPFDAVDEFDSQSRSTILSYKGGRIPIYEGSITFRHKGLEILTDEISHGSAGYLQKSNGSVLARMGYDLFREVRTLLTKGQPSANASLPALEMHIALLRDLIIGCEIPLLEIPPVPDGYPFIACLTHDVDHPSIRLHKWDHTMFGFLYRALLGSLINVVRGRAPVRSLFTNWRAVVMLPFVHLGLVKDFWHEFDRYVAMEKGLASTYFVIPFKDDPGRTAAGQAPTMRASRYGASDIADRISTLVGAGCEIGLHGIDAWMDSSKGREEQEQVTRITGQADIGIRMHWLYLDEKSPGTLEKAGFSYDSTSGYNETIGYRAGTGQAFRPLEATRLLELPLHIMDTALFYSCHLNLSPRQAWKRVETIIDNAVRFGGTVTVNWHDRSIAPERLWDEFYLKLLTELKRRQAWFSTAAQAVAWFRKRRSASFETVSWEPGMLRATVSVDGDEKLPGMRLRIHRAGCLPSVGAMGADASESYVDIGFNRRIDTRVSMARPRPNLRFEITPRQGATDS